MDRKFYITTTIPYVNATPHIGHALEFVQADAIARYRRLAGDKVYFLSGADENAIKNVQAAETAGIPIEKFVAANSAAFKELLKALNISNDQFIRTTEERHKKGAQALWKATNPDDIYKKKYQGLYCVGCELFYKENELNENNECFEHPGKKLDIVEEENYFFNLKKYENWLREIIESGELSIAPEVRKKEVLAFIGRGLEDFSISRPVSRSKNWGVLVPGDESQTIYVWYDALANYITALGYPEETDLYRDFWKENQNRFHILGKGVSRFHAIYWPAMLKSAGLPIPTSEFIHGYVTINGQKISKSLGNVIDPQEVIEKYGTDALRYYLLREIPTYNDGDFTWEKFKDRYNADLANGLGNLVARVAALGEKVSPIIYNYTYSIRELLKMAHEEYDSKIDTFKFNEALEIIWRRIAQGDAALSVTQPWYEEGSERADKILSRCIELVVIADLLEPFLPEAAQKIKDQISYDEANKVIYIKKKESLFPRK